MIRLTAAFGVCALLAVTIGAPRASGSLVASNFDNGTDGWTAVELQTMAPLTNYRTVTYGPYVPSWNASSGCPGAHIYSGDWYGNEFYFVAPGKFLGNQSANYGEKLSWCIRTVPQSGANPASFSADVVLLTDTMVLVNFDPPVATQSWGSRSVTLTESAGWHLNNASGRAPTRDEFTSVLANLTSVRILGEFWSGNETGYLDSVVMPEPASLCMLAVGCLATLRRRRR